LSRTGLTPPNSLTQKGERLVPAIFYVAFWRHRCHYVA
jgi:hypothetical protein